MWGLNPTVLLLLKSTTNLPLHHLEAHQGWSTEAGQCKGGGREGRALRKQRREGTTRDGVPGAQLPANTACFYLQTLGDKGPSPTLLRKGGRAVNLS